MLRQTDEHFKVEMPISRFCQASALREKTSNQIYGFGMAFLHQPMPRSCNHGLVNGGGFPTAADSGGSHEFMSR
jgi:hypothetical protein